MSAHGRSAPGGEGHRLLLHRSEVERASRLAEWVREGFARGEKVVYVEGGAAVERGVLATLAAQGIDVSAATSAGRLEVLAPDEFYRPGAQEALVDRVLDEGYPALRISGEATTAHEVLTPGAHREVEDLVERLCARRPVSALCQYAARSVPGAALDDVVGAHPAGVRELSVGTRGSAGRLELRGSVDVTNVDVLRASLVAALSAARGAPALRVDLSGVEHFAAAACRTIVAGSAPARASGQRLLLEGARPVVDLVLRLCRVDADGVEIVEHSR